jgi:acyl-coenzyme A synthetase/AMP-(fatty) acid ligase
VIADRLTDGEATALIVADQAMRRGKSVDMLAIADEAARSVPTLRRIVVRRRAGLRFVPVATQRTNEDLPATLSQAVALSLGRAYTPERLIVLDALPKTRNLKTMRRVIRAILIGESPGDLSSLLNPECLESIRVAGNRK